jgi:hypothetical protein
MPRSQEPVHMEKRDPNETAREFNRRQSRQIIAIALALFAVLLFAVLYKRPVLFVDLSKATLFGAQIAAIVAFMGFSAFNWRCPACGRSLGSDIHRRVCKKCGARLK